MCSTVCLICSGVLRDLLASMTCSGRTSFGFEMMINLVMKGPDVHLCRSALDDDNTYQRMIYARNLDLLRGIFELSLRSALIKC